MEYSQAVRRHDILPYNNGKGAAKPTVQTTTTTVQNYYGHSLKPLYIG